MQSNLSDKNYQITTLQEVNCILFEMLVWKAEVALQVGTACRSPSKIAVGIWRQ